MPIKEVNIKFYLNVTPFFILLSLFVFSCTINNSSEPQDETITFNAYQVGGCNKSSLRKVEVSDSSFSFTFNDTLKINFALMANCCPESRNFIVEHTIKSDTIWVSVTDNAENLCRCVCNYTIHLDLIGLSNDKYFFFCNYGNKTVYNEVINKR
jgi:hypothetical protein